MNIDQIRKKKVGLKNSSIEAEARPATTAVVIRKETLEYYQALDGLLDNALDLAGQNQPPIIQINASDIQYAMEEAAAGVIAKLAGLTGQAVTPAKALPAGPVNGSGWKSIAELIESHEPKVSAPTVYAAINEGKIKTHGSGRNRKVSEADYVAWISTRKARKNSGGGGNS